MRTLVATFRRCSILSLLAAVGCATGLAASLGSVSATAGGNSCSQNGAAGVSCSVSNGAATASGLTINTWGQVNGRLEATSDANGPGTSSSAMVSYSNMLIVTGATGSGELQINFTGFQDILSQSPAGGTVSQLLVTLGANSTQVTFPFTNTGFSAVLPVNFGVFVPFSLSFSDTANGTILQGGTFGHGNGDAALTLFPGFVVNDVTGKPVPGTTVGFIPEPATWGLLLCAVPAVWMARRRARRARTNG